MATIVWDAVFSLITFKQALEEARRFYDLKPDQEAVVQQELANIEAAWGRIHGAFYGPGAVLVKREQPPDPPQPPMTVPEIVEARRSLKIAGAGHLSDSIFPFPKPQDPHISKGEGNT